ncbi:MAG: nitrous oxide-stimulated promoter family protein [Planctomycetota bacterium]
MKTITAMVRIYCNAHHQAGMAKSCLNCTELLNYAQQRLEKCPFTPHKGPCSKCSTHCYKPEYRTRIIEVMRYSGPRMLTRHPILAFYHLLSSRHKNPSLKRTKLDIRHTDRENI